MPTSEPANVKDSPYAVNTVGAMTPVGGMQKAAMISMIPKITRITASIT